MNTIQIIYLVLIFVTVFVVALVILAQFNTRPLQARLQLLKGDAKGIQGATDEPAWVSRIVELTGPIAKLSLPKEGWEESQLRIRFMNAGYRSSSAPVLYFAAKTLLTVAVPGLFVLYTIIAGTTVQPNDFLMSMVGLAALGYFLPNAFLARRIAYRKREIFESFPDALDLIIVCVEAGLGLDAALARVGEEMHMRSPILGEELHLINLELRAGSSRERALRNLALRTGVEDIDTLVAMLVQSDRFGTSVADALRVHADSLRTKRRLRAEEAAAKIAVKLLFPLIFFIFPSMLLVLLGPAFISIHNILLPTLAGQ
ncbi:MAG: type II secretion system F family protein [Methylotenera sp.]|nr:type II secretion system F family protein [Methylotenera sp.]MDP1959204.1 type II secretion system F family protein [Methylotenera sp.]MDP2101725.1 type II secretion system F family protein [Methylotenera sp.]MDP2280884.1 type II secretion system F family protein [Methylotenera sp.]MDP3060982.1 type II secretion system F family protein [Methylotenera sp.]